jgi:hypothetical protein
MPFHRIDTGVKERALQLIAEGSGLFNTLLRYLEPLIAALIDGLTTTMPLALSNHQQSSPVKLDF